MNSFNRSLFLSLLCSFASFPIAQAKVEFLGTEKPETPSYSMGTLLKKFGPEVSPDCTLETPQQKYKNQAPQELQLLRSTDAELIPLVSSLFAAQTMLWNPEFQANLTRKGEVEGKALRDKFEEFTCHSRDTLQVARTLLSYDAPGVTYLFLGRTPNWVMHAAKIVAQKNGTWRDQFIQINYSGTPDLEIDRIGVLNQVAQNLVTPERLEIFEGYLQSLGLAQLPENQKFYIVDMLGKGGSLNSFLRILRHYYTITLKRSLPDITFMALNEDRDTPPYPPRVGGIGEIHWGAGNQHTLSFFRNAPGGIVGLTVDMIPLGLPKKTIDLYDSTLKSRWNSGSEFYACQWTQKNLEQGFKPGPLFKVIYDEIFEIEIKALIDHAKDYLPNPTQNQAATETLHKCNLCKNTKGPLLKCGRCKKTSYCNATCQKSDWPRHKGECAK